MQFNSFSFVVFMSAVFVLYWLMPHKYRWLLLLIASYGFYMCWEARFALLLLLVTLASYAAALLLEKETRTFQRKLILSFALLCTIGVLFVFKYYDFFVQSLVSLLEGLSLHAEQAPLRLLLPVGISFYSFQGFGYVMDVYRGKQSAERHFGIFAAFISFFPVISSGPIQRANRLIPQLRNEVYFDSTRACYGLKLIAWGLFKKLAIADLAAVYVSTVFSAMDIASGLDTVLALFLYAIQIYCDFSGYSDMAIGIARLLGIDLDANFKSPYLAPTLRQFWSRWHISLSTWFRDYLYFPLGGSRVSRVRRSFNLVVTFLVSGLWHGASWTYVIWGCLHGAMQIIERSFEPEPKSWKKPLRVLFVFAFCNLALIFFRAASVGEAMLVLKRLCISLLHPGAFIYSGLCLSFIELLPLLISIAVLAAFDYFSLKTDVIAYISAQKPALRWTVYLALVLFILLRMPLADAASFIYFGF